MRISRREEVVPGDLRTVVGRLRDWAVAEAERAPDKREEKVPQCPFPSAKAFSPSPSCSFNHVFHLWPK